MDIFVHGLVPYAAALWVLHLHARGRPVPRPRLAWAATFGMAGFAPDLDGAVDWLSEVDDRLYWLQHRGISHTLIGAPIFSLACLGILVALARLFPRAFGLFAWRPALLGAALTGCFTHLLLDVMTISGVPLWWPFAWGRASFELFHWIVPWLFPVAGLVLGLHAWGRLDPRGVRVAGALVVASLVALGAWRVAERPEPTEPGALVFPRSDATEWSVLVPLDNGSWEARIVKDGEVTNRHRFDHDVPPEGEDAVARARASPAHKGLLMQQFGPMVVQATPLEGGAWNVTFTDVAARWEAMNHPRWTPVHPHDAWGYVGFVVRGDHVEVTHRGW